MTARDAMHAAFMECGELVNAAEDASDAGDALGAGRLYMAAGRALADGVRRAIALFDPNDPAANVSAYLLKGEAETAEHLASIGCGLLLPHLEPAGQA